MVLPGSSPLAFQRDVRKIGHLHISNIRHNAPMERSNG
jgi:hypothetical protein